MAPSRGSNEHVGTEMRYEPALRRPRITHLERIDRSSATDSTTGFSVLIGARVVHSPAALPAGQVKTKTCEFAGKLRGSRSEIVAANGLTDFSHTLILNVWQQAWQLTCDRLLNMK